MYRRELLAELFYSHTATAARCRLARFPVWFQYGYASVGRPRQGNIDGAPHARLDCAQTFRDAAQASRAHASVTGLLYDLLWFSAYSEWHDGLWTTAELSSARCETSNDTERNRNTTQVEPCSGVGETVTCVGTDLAMSNTATPAISTTPTIPTMPAYFVTKQTPSCCPRMDSNYRYLMCLTS